MKTILSGKEVAVTVEFKVGGEFIVPDSDSEVHIMVWSDDDEIFMDNTLSQPEGGWGTTYSFTVPEADNTISSPKEYRFVTCWFYHNGEQISTQDASYIVVKLPKFTTTTDDVRLVFGLNSGELPDDKIFLEREYYDLLEEHPEFEEMFSSKGAQRTKVNRILTLRTALGFATALPMLAVQTESDGTSKISRFNVDFDAMVAKAQSELDSLTAELTETDATGVISMLNITEMNDIFTGESS